MLVTNTLLFCILSLVSASRPLPGPKAWEPLKKLLDGWLFTDDFAISVGVARAGLHQELFVYEHGGLTMDSYVGTLSTSKWPMAMALAGAVDDGTIPSLDVLVSKYVPWWTKNETDRRSRVTLRHLLSFTSGFGSDQEGQEAAAAVKCLSNHSYPDFDGCARIVYDAIGGPGGRNMTGEPGTVFCYNSYQLQLAAAMVIRASGLQIQQLLDKYLFKAYNMANTFCNGTNPELAVCMITTGRDYANFLSGVLGHQPLSKAMIEESEKDYTTFASSQYSLYGDYGFGHYLYCFDSISGRTKACEKGKVHACPGGFGFFPLIDRRLDYYMELVAFEHTNVTYPRSGIPEYLVQLVKPVVDAIMRGEDVTYTSGHATPEFMGLTLADVNYVSLCYMYPKYCGGGSAAEKSFAATAGTFPTIL